MLRRDHVEPAAETVAATALETGSLPDAAVLADDAAVGQASASETSAPVAPGYNRVGSGRFLRASLALFLAGFSTFSLLYCPQPLLPTLARAFRVDAAASSLSISFSTAALALSIVAAASLSDRLGRRSLMMVSLLGASVLNIVAAMAPNWPLFLLLRALEGAALGGVPAVAMTYLAEETDPGSLGLAMGIYVGATAVGGMGGRVITGLVAAAVSWRVAVATIGVVGLAGAVSFLILLPASRHFRPRATDLRNQLNAFGGAVADPRLILIYGFAFLVMGGFVAVYNYAGFRLEAPPYRLDQAQEGLIFTLYLLGTVGSALAGTLADRLGRAPVMMLSLALSLLGVASSLFGALSAVVLGIALVTLGFFAGHGVASGTVGLFAGPNKAQAASLYLLSYYAGSSLLGTAGGWFWIAGGWPAVAGFVAALFGGAILLAGLLAQVQRNRPSP